MKSKHAYFVTIVRMFLFWFVSRPTSDGSAAAILASEDFVRKHGLESQAIEIVAQSMATDLPSTFTEKNVMKMVRQLILAMYRSTFTNACTCTYNGPMFRCLCCVVQILFDLPCVRLHA